MGWIQGYLYIVISILIMLLEIYFWAHFTGGGLERKQYIVLAAVMLVAMYVFFRYDSLWYQMGMGIVLFLAGSLVRKNIRPAYLLTAMLTVEITSLSYGLSDSVFSILSPVIFRLPLDKRLYFMIAGSSLLPIIITYICYRAILKRFTLNWRPGGQYTLMILVPLLLIFLSEEYINGTVYGNTTTMTQEGQVLGIPHHQMLLIQLLALFSVFCILYAYRKLQENFDAKTEVALLEQQTQMQKEYVAEARTRYEQTKAFRHDIKNHLLVLKGLYDSGDFTDAQIYMEELGEITDSLSLTCNTNNAVLDILLGSKLAVARQHGIKTECRFELPNSCMVDDTDLCVIFANALDNAINGCAGVPEDKKFIHIHGECQGDFLMVQVENSCQDAGDNRVSFGTGLANMNAVAQKYGGALSAEREDGSFKLHVLLIITQQPDDISQQPY